MRLVNENDFRGPHTDDSGAIPCWKEARKPTHRSGWAVIVYGRWLQDTKSGQARYWTARPTEEERKAVPWDGAD